MADRMLLISWGSTVNGREERALDVFNESMGFYGRMQQDGRIESFDVTLLRPNSDMAGYIALHGTGDQIDSIQNDDEFLRIQAEAGLIVEDLRTCEGYTGEGVAQLMGIFREAISRVTQTA
jgi:hypothetical protein